MSVKERLIKFLKYKGIGQKKFADKIGVSSGYVNAIRISIQPKTLDKIAMHFPELNTSWLLTGEGEMLRNTDTPSSNENNIELLSKLLSEKDARLKEKDETIAALKDNLTSLQKQIALLESKIETPQYAERPTSKNDVSSKGKTAKNSAHITTLG